MEKVVKPVSLNDEKEEDIRVLNFIRNQNFSGYVKQLILDDIERRNRPLQIVQRTPNGGMKIVVSK